jgi:hypothetical protein
MQGPPPTFVPRAPSDLVPEIDSDRQEPGVHAGRGSDRPERAAGDAAGHDRRHPRHRPHEHYEFSLYTHGVSEIMTADTDFRKFPFLTVTNPFRPAR